MTLDERFEQLGVPTSDELPADMRDVVQRGLEEGRTLMITRRQIPDEDGVLIWQAEWAFLKLPHKEKRTQIIVDPDAPPPYDPDEL